MILDQFKITENEDLKRWEFKSLTNEYTSYTVSFSECDNKEDACIAVWKSIQAEKQRKSSQPTENQ